MAELVANLENFMGFDFKKDKIKVEESTVQGATDNEIKIVEIYLKKASHTTKFVKLLLKKMSKSDKQMVSDELDERLDEDCNFYMRFDKDLLFDKNELSLINGGNCVHIKFSVASYPKNRNVAMGIAREIFG